MSHQQLFAIRTGDPIKIQILGQEFECLSGRGKEYSDESAGRFSCGYPFYPYKMESIINDVDDEGRTAAFLIDKKNIIWVYTGNGQIVRPSLQVGLTYVNLYDIGSYDDVWNLVK
jgi:hypothetical protein